MNANIKRPTLTEAEWAVYEELQRMCSTSALMHVWSQQLADYAVKQGIAPEMFGEAMAEASQLFRDLNELLIEYAERTFPGRVTRVCNSGHINCCEPAQNAPAPAKIGGGN